METKNVVQIAQEYYNDLDLSEYNGEQRLLAEQFAKVATRLFAEFICSLDSKNPENIELNIWNDFDSLLETAKNIFDDLEIAEFKRIIKKRVENHDPDDALSISDYLLLDLRAMMRSHVYAKDGSR